jgi:hypothetical protein
MAYESKDLRRIEGILERAAKGGYGGRALTLRELAFSRNMANAVLDPAKAERRGNAASAIGRHDIAKIFYVRRGQLTS